MLCLTEIPFLSNVNKKKNMVTFGKLLTPAISPDLRHAIAMLHDYAHACEHKTRFHLHSEQTVMFKLIAEDYPQTKEKFEPWETELTEILEAASLQIITTGECKTRKEFFETFSEPLSSRKFDGRKLKIIFAAIKNAAREKVLVKEVV